MFVVVAVILSGFGNECFSTGFATEVVRFATAYFFDGPVSFYDHATDRVFIRCLCFSLRSCFIFCHAGFPLLVWRWRMTVQNGCRRQGLRSERMVHIRRLIHHGVKPVIRVSCLDVTGQLSSGMAYPSALHAGAAVRTDQAPDVF